MNDYYAEKYNLDEYLKKPESEERSSQRRSRTNSRAGVSKSAGRTARSSVRRNTAKKSGETRGRREKSRTSARYAAPRNSRRNQPKPPMKKSKKILITFAVLIVVAGISAVAFAVGSDMYRNYRKSLPFHYSQRVSVAGIDISGLTAKEARAKLKAERMTAVKDVAITVNARGKVQKFTKDSFTYKFDYKTPLKEAKKYSLREQGLYDPPAGVVEDETELTSDNPEFKMNYEVEQDSITQQVNKLALKVDKSPVNARVSKFRPFAENRFTYKEGMNGYQLDREWLCREISYFFNDGRKEATIDAAYDTIKPEITVNDLKENIVGLSRATSYSNNTLDGTHNMAVALSACNGSVIEPGEIWSFNKHTGDSNREDLGYRKAQVIVEKKLEEGVGGGICQASTAVFKAAVLANMGVIERHNHYWASGYAYAGEDATIDYPNLDLRLRNNTDYQMFMECKADGNNLIVNIYGYQEPEYDNIKIYSENYDIEEEERFHTRTFRVLYKDHKVVRKETICTSTYSLTDNHVVRIEDEGTFRTSVSGITKSEAE